MRRYRTARQPTMRFVSESEVRYEVDGAGRTGHDQPTRAAQRDVVRRDAGPARRDAARAKRRRGARGRAHRCRRPRVLRGRRPRRHRRERGCRPRCTTGAGCSPTCSASCGRSASRRSPGCAGYALRGWVRPAPARATSSSRPTTREFGTPEINVGLWPYMITVPLLRSMPPKKVLELMMTGRRVDAVEAERIGFVTRVVPVDELDAAVDELAATLASKSPLDPALGTRRVLPGARAARRRRRARLPAGDAHGHAHTEDAAEGVAAFAREAQPRSGRAE